MDSIQPTALLGIVTQANGVFARVIAGLLRDRPTARRRREEGRELLADRGQVFVHLTFQLVLLHSTFWRRSERERERER